MEGEKRMLHTTRCDSPLGCILLAEKEGALAGLWMEGQKYFLGSLREEARAWDDAPVFRQTKAWLGRYFAGQRPEIGELPLAPDGSAFRKLVWELLCEIPYGETTTYGEIANRVAVRRGCAKMSAQAVGGAVGHNPISIIIPCHRVVGVAGSLTGYAGGIDKKIKLLTHEGVDMAGLFASKRSTAP